MGKVKWCHCSTVFHFILDTAQASLYGRNVTLVSSDFSLHHSFAAGSGNQVGPSPCAGKGCVGRLLSMGSFADRANVTQIFI